MKNHVLGYVHDALEKESEGLIEFLQQYVRFRSVNPERAVVTFGDDIAQCQKWLFSEIRGWGCFDKTDIWAVEPGQPNVAAVVLGTGEGEGRSLLFHGHTDTVDVTPEQATAWVGGDPWSAHRDGRNIYGRGTSDMKGANAAFLWAARAVRRCGVKLNRNLHIGITIGEESSNRRLGPDSLLSRGYGADLILNGEPTQNRVGAGAPGWFFLRITTTGKSLHPASRYRAVYPTNEVGPLPGVDAIAKMRRIMDQLSALEQDWALHEKHPLLPPGGVNLCPIMIEGGGLRAEMPDRCVAHYAVVFSPSRRLDDVMAEIRAAVEGVALTDSWLREHPPVLEMPVLEAPFEGFAFPRDHSTVQQLVEAASVALRRQVPVVSMPGPSDANVMAMKGHQVLIFGPGDLGYGAHGPNEFIPVEELLDASKAYASMILAWCGHEG